MKRIWTFVPLVLALSVSSAYSGDGYDGYDEASDWTGFRVGLGTGFFWSANNVVRTNGLPNTANPLFLPASQVLSNTLGYLTSHHFSYPSSGFLGGVQLGYLSQFSDKLVIGVDADINGLGSSHESKYLFSATSVTGLGTHFANGSVSKKINYLGFVKGRLGYLLKPTIMGYGIGAFAYGGAKLTTSFSILNSNPLLLPAYGEINVSSLMGGWGAGLGGEWLLSPCWSISAEYLYYNLGPLNSYLSLDQNLGTSPVISLATAKVKTVARFRDNALRLGVNYRFG